MTSPAARSPATCPAAALIARAAVAPARARAAAVSAALMSRLRGEWRLQRSLTALRAVYLGGAGEAAANFSAAVFARLDRCGSDAAAGAGSDSVAATAWADSSELSSALVEALEIDESGELPDTRDVSIDIISQTAGGMPPGPGTPRQRRQGTGSPSRSAGTAGAAGTGGAGGAEMGEGASQLQALEALRLSVRIPWPLTLVIPESCLERYNAAAVFLLQVGIRCCSPRHRYVSHVIPTYATSSSRQARQRCFL